MTKTTISETRRTAYISDRIPDTEFPFRVFYYAPGTGFDSGTMVYVGRSEFRTLAEAQESKRRYDRD